MSINILPILALLVAVVALVVAFVSYPAMLPLVMTGGAIVLAILATKE